MDATELESMQRDVSACIKHIANLIEKDSKQVHDQDRLLDYLDLYDEIYRTINKIYDIYWDDIMKVNKIFIQEFMHLPTIIIRKYNDIMKDNMYSLQRRMEYILRP